MVSSSHQPEIGHDIRVTSISTAVTACFINAQSFLQENLSVTIQSIPKIISHKKHTIYIFVLLMMASGNNKIIYATVPVLSDTLPRL
jgi:hypothetical protein